MFKLYMIPITGLSTLKFSYRHMTYCKGISCPRPDSNPRPSEHKVSTSSTITPRGWIKVETGIPVDIRYPN